MVTNTRNKIQWTPEKIYVDTLEDDIGYAVKKIGNNMKV